jgi:hypothetical protein
MCLEGIRKITKTSARIGDLWPEILTWSLQCTKWHLQSPGRDEGFASVKKS